MTISPRMRTFLFAWLTLTGFCLAGGAQPAHAGPTANDCRFGNTEGTPWRLVTPLTESTPVGATLYQRTISLTVNYRFGFALPYEHELVYAGHWGPYTYIRNGIAKTNVDGIGFKWVGVGKDGVERTFPQTSRPLVLATERLMQDGRPPQTNTGVATLRQYLILEKPASQLPEGKLVVSSLLGNPITEVYAIDLQKGEAIPGETVEVPGYIMPPNRCNHSIKYTGVENLTLGGGGPIEVPNTCEVQSNFVVPVNLGHFSLSQFGSVNATSQPVNFSIVLNRCAAAAKPAISFRDKAVQPNPDKTLLQLSAPGGQALAQGFNIVMTDTLSGARIAYDEPGVARQYPMRRIGDTAEMLLHAQYIRTGADGALKPGYAGGAAEFTFTFP
ncbi:type 1 fimbrial protein [Burkholderia sp. FERM BP-3421]|jgi:type 1 fimbria pilin|uniref:fimbrial protein n=1 Tax=Burkholderia sp. FERM BP-3421 TaxID=1494466 RepID=UPI00235F0840|nr:fimbrial protein [Burkholderia sp. FERM BP-3421]WDD94246.1 type 1 fimbrial protein [Burkholderia sp. FERM BP-3421]